MDEATFRAWAERVAKAHAALETSSYYRLLGVPEDAPQEVIRQAYHRRAQQLHPDRHRETAEPVKSQVYALFKRMTEAYRVLTDPDERRAYDQGLTQGKVRREDAGTAPPAPRRPEEQLRTPGGQRHYRAALDAVQRKDFSAAELNIKLAITHEGGNPPFLYELLEQLRAARKPPG